MLIGFLVKGKATDADLVSAMDYQTAVLASDGGMAWLCNHSFIRTDICSSQGPQPAWFAAALQNGIGAAMEPLLDPIRQALVLLQGDVDVIRENVDTTMNRVAQIQVELAHVRRMAAIVECFISSLAWLLIDQLQTWNGAAGSTRDAPLEVVPFVTAEDPTAPPVNFLKSCLLITMLTTFSQHNLPVLHSKRRVQNLSAVDRDAYYRGYYPGDEALPLVQERTRHILIAIGLWS